MSLREGTRRKKISVLHMLGTWENKIEGCNCPSCREVDEEERSNLRAAKINKSDNKKIQKVNLHSPIKISKIQLKSEILNIKLEEEDKNVFENEPTRFSNSFCKTTLNNSKKPKEEAITHLIKNVKNLKKTVMGHCVDIGKVVKFECKDKIFKENIYIAQCDEASVLLDEPNVCLHDDNKDNFIVKTELSKFSDEEKENKIVLDNHENLSVNHEEITSEMDHGKELLGSCAANDFMDDSIDTLNAKPKGRQKQILTNINNDEPLFIKQEPDEYFSDEDLEKFQVKETQDISKCENRLGKRSRMVTSEMDNIYAKPRMMFTGRGVVRKFEPGSELGSHSKRGRKPNKIIKQFKVKKELKDSDELDNDSDGIEDGQEGGGELDQLHRVLSEAEIDEVEDEFFDALEEFGEEPKEIKSKRKSKMFKKIESNGDKYVECNMCFKMLKESSIKQHCKTHTGEKPYPCDECEARFTRKGDVDRHKRLVHKNLKPFKCRKCFREFSDRKNLKSHLQNHDKAVYYACDTCSFKFGKREYYENHIRYIHPLPDGVLPLYPDTDEDVTAKQLREIEQEEKRDKKYIESTESGRSSTEPDDEDDDDEEDDKQMEITVTEGQEAHTLLDSEQDDTNYSINKNENKITSQSEVIEDELKLTDTADSMSCDNITNNTQGSNYDIVAPNVSTDVSVTRGTLSFTQTINNPDTQDEDLVNEVIAAAVSQATNTIESLQYFSGPNLTGNYIADLEEEEEYDMMENEDDDLDMEESEEELTATQLTSSKEGLIEQPTEIHISASVGGQIRKFIIQVPLGNTLNVQTPEGMELIVNMVNQLCAGKGTLDGPIEVVMHNPNARTYLVE